MGLGQRLSTFLTVLSRFDSGPPQQTEPALVPGQQRASNLKDVQ